MLAKELEISASTVDSELVMLLPANFEDLYMCDSVIDPDQCLWL